MTISVAGLHHNNQGFCNGLLEYLASAMSIVKRRSHMLSKAIKGRYLRIRVPRRSFPVIESSVDNINSTSRVVLGRPHLQDCGMDSHKNSNHCRSERSEGCPNVLGEVTWDGFGFEIIITHAVIRFSSVGVVGFLILQFFHPRNYYPMKESSSLRWLMS